MIVTSVLSTSLCPRTKHALSYSKSSSESGDLRLVLNMFAWAFAGDFCGPLAPLAAPSGTLTPGLGAGSTVIRSVEVPGRVVQLASFSAAAACLALRPCAAGKWCCGSMKPSGATLPYSCRPHVCVRSNPAHLDHSCRRRAASPLPTAPGRATSQSIIGGLHPHSRIRPPTT